MKKETSLFFAMVLATFMLMSFASATTLNATNIPTISIVGTTGSFTFNVISDSNGTVNASLANINSQYGSGVISFYAAPVTVSANTSTPMTVSYNVSDPDSYFNFLSSYQTKLTLNGQNSSSNVYTVTLNDNDFCTGIPNVANILRVDQPSFKIVNGYGDADHWYLLDNLSASVDVQNNNNNFDLRNVKVEWALYTTNGNKIDSGSLSTFNLNAGDDKTVEFDFKLDKSMNRIDKSGGRVFLYVKASGTINNPDAPYTYDGNKSCSFYQNAQQSIIETGDDFMIPTDLTVNGNLLEDGYTLGNSVSCGSTVNLGGTIYNIGNSDQNSGSYVVMYNKELGLNQVFSLGSINSFESQDFSASFVVPKTADEKLYPVQFTVYDNKNRLFENGQNDQAIKNIYLNVSGGCAIAAPYVTAEISAGETKEGGQIIIHTYIRNDDKKTQTFTISPQNYNTWADLVNVTPETFTLSSGYSKDVYLTFNLKSGSAGNQQFDLVAVSNGQVASDKQIALSIAKGSVFNGINWELVGIVALNIILLIAIIIVAVKILRKR